jgi:hypothetical protein
MRSRGFRPGPYGFNSLRRRLASFSICFSLAPRLGYCHENGESSHEKSKTYGQVAVFMLRGAPKAHAACCKIAIILIEQESVPQPPCPDPIIQVIL